jgi:hypothetical protein
MSQFLKMLTYVVSGIEKFTLLSGISSSDMVATHARRAIGL